MILVLPRAIPAPPKLNPLGHEWECECYSCWYLQIGKFRPRLAKPS
jgi:hypothetical protein